MSNSAKATTAKDLLPVNAEVACRFILQLGIATISIGCALLVLGLAAIALLVSQYQPAHDSLAASVANFWVTAGGIVILSGLLLLVFSVVLRFMSLIVIEIKKKVKEEREIQ